MRVQDRLTLYFLYAHFTQIPHKKDRYESECNDIILHTDLHSDESMERTVGSVVDGRVTN